MDIRMFLGMGLKERKKRDTARTGRRCFPFGIVRT